MNLHAMVSGELPPEVGAMLHVEHPVGEPLIVPVTLIDPNPHQPRQVFDEEALSELSDSIKEVGIIQPVVVRPKADGRYELVAGERRLRATKRAGLADIPVVVRNTADDNMLRDALLENLQRDNLNPIEEALAYEALIVQHNCTQEELGRLVSKSRAAVGHSLKLLRLPEDLRNRVAAGVISVGHAKLMFGMLDVVDEEVLVRLADRIVREQLTVRATEEILALGEHLPDPVRESISPRPRAPKPDYSEEMSMLEALLDTRVRIDGTRAKGHIRIDFADRDDLQRIVQALCSARQKTAS